MNRVTIFDSTRAYRYTLWREWETLGTDQRFVQFIGLNPSTADETQDDPTIRRCIAFAKSWGYPAMCMTNLFAYRSTDPAAMLAHSSPEGIDNLIYLTTAALNADRVVCAWGNHGSFHEQGHLLIAHLREILEDNFASKVFCLGKTGTGQPKHPLYLKKTTLLQPV